MIHLLLKILTITKCNNRTSVLCKHIKMENYGICRFMLGLKGPKHDKLDKTLQHFHNDSRVNTSQVHGLTWVTEMAVAA